MSALLVFLIAYGGVGGKDVKQVDKQVRGIVSAQTEVQDVKLSSTQRHAIVTHGSDATDLVRALEVTGLITGEVERTKKRAVLHVVIYAGDGTLLDLLELPLGKKATKKIGKDTLESLSDTIVRDIEILTAPPPEPEPEPVVADADLGSDAELPEVTAVAPARRPRGPKVKLAVGAGMRSRTFDPGPAMVRGYTSSVVPAATVVLEIMPLRHVTVGGTFDRTLTMNTQLATEEAPTSILGWSASAAVGLPLGSLDLALVGGVGGREFVIASAGAAPTPDGLYTYAIIGGRLGVRLGERVQLRAQGSYQPVIGGDVDMPSEPTGRAGYEVAAALEIAASAHLFVVGEAGFQRFTWTWDDGASADSYPRGTLAVGARY